MRRVWRGLAWCWWALTAVLGPGEALLVLGLALVTFGAWPIVGQAALIVPGAVAVWLALPTRTSFIEHLPMTPERRQER